MSVQRYSWLTNFMVHWTILLISVTLAPMPCLAANGEKDVRVTDILCSITSLSMKIVFKGGFNGVIFAQKHYAEPACRKSLSEPKRLVRFTLPGDGCGTTAEARGEDVYFSNSIVVQRSPVVETDGDVALNVSCKVDLSFTKLPSPHDSLAFDLRYEVDGFDARMAFKQGLGPGRFGSVRKVSVGQRFLVVVHHTNLEDADTRVKKCWAHSEPAVGGSDASYPVYDVKQCPPAALAGDNGGFRETVNVTRTLFDIELKAFRFPESLIMYFTCTVEVCAPRCVQYCPSRRPMGRRDEDEVTRRAKRDAAPATDSRTFDDRMKLMKATIDALKKTIIKQQQSQRSLDDGKGLAKRTSPEDDEEEDPAYEDGDTNAGVMLDDHEDDDANADTMLVDHEDDDTNADTMLVDHEDDDTNADTMLVDHENGGTNAATALSNKKGEVKLNMTPETVIYMPEIFEFNLTRNLIVLPLRRVGKADEVLKESWFEALTNTAPEGAFLLVCILLGIVIILLLIIICTSFITCVGLLRRNKLPLPDYD